MAFEKEGTLDTLEHFASHAGADFYGVERNAGTVTLKREDWQVPETYEFGGDVVVPFYAGEVLPWKVVAEA
jgi:dihydroorotase